MAQSTHHPTTEELSAYSLGRLTPDLAQSVEQHVSECLPCCETIVQLSSDDTFVDLLQEVGPSPAQERTQVGDTTIDHPDTVPQPLLDHPRYEVLSLIGQGGMGRVYRARHRMMDRAVAIKVINREWVCRPEVIDRFRREVKTAASLDHRNIVTSHDAEQAGDLHFLVMEHVQGVDLAETVRQRGPLPVFEACEYIQQAAGGLQYAHDRGMVHRDIKPHNLIVTPDRVVKILDFGLASLAPQASPQQPPGEDTNGHLTIAGAIMGTPDFISPEQAQDARQVDGRSDIYSLGMTLYYLLAGKVPFDRGTATDKLRQHAESEPPSLSTVRDDVPPDLQQLISRMTAKDPADRFQNPEQVRAALQPFLPGEPSQTAAELPSEVQRAASSTSPERSRRSGLQVLVSVALGGLLALAGFVYLQWNSPQRDRDRLDTFLSSGTSSEPVGDILRRLLRSETGRTYLRSLDARYPKLAYTSGEFSPGYSAVAAVAYEDRVAGTPQPELLVIGSSMTTSGMHQRSLPQELILQSVEFDQAPDDTCQAIFHVITLDEIEFMELKTGSVYESRIGIKDLLGQNGRQSKSLFDAFVAGRYQRKATAAEAKAAQWEFQRDLVPPPSGPRPAVSPLIDRTLTGIRDNTATWVFTWDKVTITSDTPGQPIPADIAWEVLKSQGEHQQIHASWQLMNRNQEVELFNIKVDGKPSTHEVRLPFSAAGKIRVNLGSHQYNCRPTGQSQPSRISPQAMTELQTGGGRRAAQIAEAVCRAAGVSADQWTAFRKDPAAERQMAGDPLSLVLPMQMATLPGRAPAKLSDLRAAMSLSMSRGYYSLLQPQYITDLAWKVTVQDGEATLNGRVCFNGLGLYAGRVNFRGRCRPGNSDTAPAGDVVIEITQFSVPAAGSVITKQDDGQWALSKVEATGEDPFADDYDLSLVPAAAIEVHGFSPSRLHKDDRFVQLMKHLAISPMKWATLFDGRVEQTLVVKLGNGREGQKATIGLLTIGDGTALEFARSLATDAFADAPDSLPLEEALRRPAERFHGRLAFRLLDGRTLAIGEEQDLNALSEMQSEPRDGEFVAASAVFSKSVHQAFSLAKPMDPVWLKRIASESADSPFVPVLLPHLPLVTECSSLAATLSLNETASLSLHVRVASQDKQAVMTKSLQSLTETLRKLSQAIPTGADRVSGSGFLQLTPLASAVLHEALNTATVIEPSDLDSRLVIPLGDAAPQLRPYIESVLTENTSRQSAYEAVSANHLKQLAIAFLLFEQEYGYLPSVKTTLPEAKFPVSWRVAILPYLGEERLYEQYDLNQPWDSLHNKTLLQSTPSFYRHPTQKQDAGGTNYVTIAGVDTATGNGQSPLSMDDVQSGDNPQSTLLLAETVAQIPWTSPNDPTYDEALPLPSLGGVFPHGFQVAMVDGSVHGIPATVTDQHLAALITRNGQEPVDLDALRAAFAAARSGMRAIPQQRP